MQDKGFRRLNPYFSWFMFLLFGPLFKVYFRLTCKKDRQRLNTLTAQSRPLIIVFNHTSYLDVPVVGLCLGIRFMRRVTLPGKKELFDDKKTRWLVNLAGAVPLDRDMADSSAARTLLRALRGGQHVLMAPEGTRSADGEVQPFKPGFIKLAHKAKAIILPVGIQGAAQALPRGASFPKPRKIRVTVGEPIDPLNVLGDKVSSADALRVAELVRQSILDLVAGDR